jgi:hypothetical protein
MYRKLLTLSRRYIPNASTVHFRYGSKNGNRAASGSRPFMASTTDIGRLHRHVGLHAYLLPGFEKGSVGTARLPNYLACTGIRSRQTTLFGQGVRAGRVPFLEIALSCRTAPRRRHRPGIEVRGNRAVKRPAQTRSKILEATCKHSGGILLPRSPPTGRSALDSLADTSNEQID